MRNVFGSCAADGRALSSLQNGYGIIYIAGSGFSEVLGYGARPLKERQLSYVEVLAKAGYTVFAINHRAAPMFRYPAIVEDAQRAVRFVRHDAATFGINAQRIGAAGGSSGAHLVSMLGTLDGKGVADDSDPVNRESAKVQCVVARAAPADMGERFVVIVPAERADSSDLAAIRINIVLKLGRRAEGTSAGPIRQNRFLPCYTS